MLVGPPALAKVPGVESRGGEPGAVSDSVVEGSGEGRVVQEKRASVRCLISQRDACWEVERYACIAGSHRAAKSLRNMACAVRPAIGAQARSAVLEIAPKNASRMRGGLVETRHLRKARARMAGERTHVDSGTGVQAKPGEVQEMRCLSRAASA